MDLFGDLPPPASSTDKGEAKESLFGGLPSAGNNVGSKRHQLENVPTPPVNKRPKTDLYTLKGYIAERQGEREDMQDAHVIMDDVPTADQPIPNDVHRIAYYGVFDGHGGARASHFTAENLHKNIFKKLPKGDSQHFDKDVRKCLTESFKKTDEDFLAAAAKATPTWKDGTTVVTLLVIDNVVFSANLGDSRAYSCKRDDGKIVCVPLTKDHNPSNFEERKRIEKNGGIVRDGRVMGVVEVSRSIGDGRFKHCGVISVPDIFKCQLTDNHLFLILACDGLWKVFTCDEAVKLILNIIEDESITIVNDKEVRINYVTEEVTDRGFRFETACNKLAVEAVKRGCTDNVTVMIVDLKSQK